MLSSSWAAVLAPEQAGQLRALLRAAAETDLWPRLAPAGPWPAEFTGGVHLLWHEDGALVGYGHLNEGGDAFGRQVAEVIVHPAHRRRGHGTAMLDTVLERSPGILRAWSHADHPAAAVLAERRGFARVRELLRMAVDLDGVELPLIRLPDGVRLRSFTPDDAQAVVDVNARAFSWHPEQSAMSVADLRAAQEADDFDAAGFFLAAAEPEGEQGLRGFHWTKVHPADSGADPVGEVYVVGVDPDAQGSGLGRALTVAGLQHLREKGLHQVILYTEGDNTAARGLYERLGFTVAATAVQYERTVSDQ